MDVFAFQLMATVTVLYLVGLLLTWYLYIGLVDYLGHVLTHVIQAFQRQRPSPPAAFVADEGGVSSDSSPVSKQENSDGL